MLPTSSPKRFIANERDEIRNETKLFLGNAPTFIFLLSFTIPLRKERAVRERERERETIFGSGGGVIIAQTHCTRREVRQQVNSKGFFIIIIAEVLVSFFLSLSLSPEELSRGHQRYKNRSLSLFLLAQTVSLNHFSIYHTNNEKIIIIIAISLTRALSRPVFSAPDT